MSAKKIVLYREGSITLAAGVRAAIDPELTRDGVNPANVDHVEVSGGGIVASIQGGTFDIQNITDAQQTITWSAQTEHTIQADPNQAAQAGVGPGGANPSPRAALVIPGGSGGLSPNRIIVGNALAGDTAQSCDVLDDGSGAALKAAIEAATTQDILIKQGVYTLEPAVYPIIVPDSVRVQGVGRQTQLICQERFDAFTMQESSSLSDLRITLDFQGAPTPGASVIALADNVKCQNIEIETINGPAANDTSLLGIFSGAAVGAEILDCVINCDFQKTTNPLGNGGVNAISATLQQSKVRLRLRQNDRGINLLGRNNHVEIVGLMGQLGNLEGIAQTLVSQVETTDEGNEALLLNNLTEAEITGSIKHQGDTGDTGISINNTGGAVTNSKISCNVSGYNVCIDQIVGQDNTITGCRLRGGGLGPVLNLQGGSDRTVVTGNAIESIEPDATCVQVQNAADRTTITGNTMFASGAASVGIDLIAGSTNTVPVSNILETNTGIADASGDAATNAAVAAAAALNI